MFTLVKMKDAIPIPADKLDKVRCDDSFRLFEWPPPEYTAHSYFVLYSYSLS